MKIDFTPDPSLYPFEPHCFTSYAGQMHYIDEGDGPPILFCHGNPTWSFLYRNIIAGLRGRFRCVGELVDRLQLDGFITVSQDWGGPVSMAVGSARAERVRGVVLGNAWFWPADQLGMKLSTAWMQRQIREKNFFVERIVSRGMAHRLTPGEMDHYRKVQPSPARARASRKCPKQILAARPLLQRLARDVPATLGSKPALLVRGMEDFAFKPRYLLLRMQATFPGNVTVELPHARHYIQEAAGERGEPAFEEAARQPDLSTRVRGPRCKRLACQRRRGQGEHDTRDEQHQDEETSKMS
jgi:haloalkane dehalogenase